MADPALEPTPQDAMAISSPPLPVDAPKDAVDDTEVKPVQQPANYFDQYDAEAQASDPGLFERARLNALHSYYRGTIAGSTELAGLAHVYQLPDEGVSADQKQWRKEQRDKYEGIVDDLGRYDLIAPWSTTLEGAAALTGQLGGSLGSPESYVNGPVKGASLLVRAAKAAVTQAAVSGATDPIVQFLDIKGGVQNEYDPMQTLTAAGTGAVIGGGLHVGGELLSSEHIKGVQMELAKEDAAFKSADTSVSPEVAAGVAEHNAAWDTAAAKYGTDYSQWPQTAKDEWRASQAVETTTAVQGTATASESATAEATSPVQAIVSSGEPAVRPTAEAPTPTTPDQQALIAKRDTVTGEPTELAMAQRAKGGTLAMERMRPEQGISTEAAQTGTDLVTIPKDASPQQADAIRSLQQQAFDLADALDFPLRQGRIKSKNALGTFNTGSGVVRVREVPDFEVVAHEAGHAIEAKVGKDLTDLTNKFSTELAPLVSNAAAYDPSQHVKEGFAEFIRRYIGNPAHAEQVAPGFTTAFRDFMGKNNPEMLAAIDKASVNYRAYLDAPSVDAVGAVVRSRAEEAKGWRGLVQKIREDGFPAIVKTVVQNAYTNLLDDKAPITRAVRDLARSVKDKSGGLVNLKAADNPEVLMRLFERSHQSAVRDMMDGVRPYHSVTPEGPSLSSALEIATGGVNSGGWGKWDPAKKSMFSDYLVARRASLLWDKFKRGDLSNPPVAFSKADAVVAMADLERANPRFREASDIVHQWTRELLRKQFDGGLIDADLFNKLSQEEFYVPFMRDLSDKPLAGGGGTRGSSEGPGMTDTIKRIKGSSRDIKDPIESLMTQAFLVNRTIAHNDIIKSFVRLSEKAGIEGGRLVEKIPAREAKKYTFDLGQAIERKAVETGMNADDAKVLTAALTDVFGEDPVMGSFFRMEPAAKRGEPIVFYKEGGQLKAARFATKGEGHALYETLTQLPQPLTDVWSQMVAATSSVMRTGITSNPMFALTNYIRDQFAVSILRNDYVPIVSGVKGVADEFRQGQNAVLYGYGGGVSGGASIAPLEHAIENDVNALAKKGYLVNRLTSFKGFLDLAGFTEAGTRNSVFGKVYAAKKAQGLSDYEAMIEAAFQAQDTLDFSRHGSQTLMIRKYIPFLNAWVQGLDKARRVMAEPIIQKMRGDQVFASDPKNLNNAMAAITKLFGVGGVLGAGWAALNAEKEGYIDASPQIKGSHIVVPWGRNIFLIPKPFELGLGFTAGEYAYQQWAMDDPRAASQFATAAWDSLTSGNPLYDIPLVKTAIELKTGKSLFTGKDIVPENLQRLAPQEQYFDKTSALAKTLGKQIGVSPIKIDYAIGSGFGLWGRDIMTLSSGVNPDSPAQSWEDMVFLRRLIKDPTRTSDVTTKFWNFMGQTSGQYNQDVATYDDMTKKFRDGDARDFLNKLPNSEKAFVIMKSAADENGKAAFAADEKRLHPLQRAYDAVTLLNGLRRELTENTFHTYEGKVQLKLPPETQRLLIENVRELAQAEMRNSFVIMKEPGYAGRQLLNVNDTMDKIMAIDPRVGEEIATRYATAKIYKTDAIAQAYPKLQSELIQNGSDADLKSLSYDAKGDGYEFDGEAAKKPQKRRMTIH